MSRAIHAQLDLFGSWAKILSLPLMFCGLSLAVATFILAHWPYVIFSD